MMNKQEPQKYKGFVQLECPKCGYIRTTCLRSAADAFRCRCGHIYPLENMYPAYFNCSSCGRNARYLTNRTEDWIEIECVECGAPNDLLYSDRKGRYEGIP